LTLTPEGLHFAAAVAAFQAAAFGEKGILIGKPDDMLKRTGSATRKDTNRYWARGCFWSYS
jgi:hypothetical protein